MRKSKTVARLLAGEVVQMCALGHYIPAFVRHAGANGFDCIWLDLEHRLIDDRDVATLLAYSHLCDVDIMIRPPTLEKTRLYRYFEDGAAGVMIPHVSTAEKAQSIVNAVKFPPIGDRGLDGSGLDSDFYLQGGADYPEQANRETFVVVQIETPQAVANVDEIAAVNGLDGLFVGPGDLGLRLRHSPSEPSLEDCISRVAAAARQHGKAWGLPVATSEELEKRRAQGAQILAHGGDFFAIIEALKSAAADFKPTNP